jgi:hypothetical protein
MESVSEQIAILKQSLISLEEDATKVDKGNKAAGTRVRRTLMEVSNQSKKIRISVLEKTRRKD